MIRSVFFFLVVLLSLASYSQGDPMTRRAVIDSLLNPVLLEGRHELVRFDRHEQSIGTLTEDDAPRALRFMCRNVSEKKIVISQVRTTCSCATSEVSGAEISPGGECVITLTYHPRNHPGTADVSAFVYLKGYDSRPVARLRVTGEVLPGTDEWARWPHAMGTLRLKRREVVFRVPPGGGDVVERVLCANSGKHALKLSSLVKPSFVEMRTEPEVILPGAEGDIVLTLCASRLPKGKGKERRVFPVVLEGVTGRPADRTLEIVIINEE